MPPTPRVLIAVARCHRRNMLARYGRVGLGRCRQETGTQLVFGRFG